jgi:hypothetical protein
MEELLNLIASDESPSDVSDRIKEILYAKSAEKVDAFRPKASQTTFFGQETPETEGSED